MVNRNYITSDRVKKIIEKNGLFLLGVPLFCLLGGAGYYFYSLHVQGQQERAQLAFSQTLLEVHHGQKNAELWSNAQLAAKTGYRAFKNSTFGPYFLVLEAKAAVAQGDTQEGYKLLQEALQQIGSGSPLYSIYATKLALIKLDIDDAAIQNEGFKELEKLAYDKTNLQRDQALYYLGDYYMNHDNKEKGLSVWQELKKDFSATQANSASPWVLLVDEKIQ